MRKLPLLALILILPNCGNVGLVTGGDLTYCGSFSEDEAAAIDLALLVYICPKIKDRLDGKPCTSNLIGRVLREAQLYFYEGGKDYCVDYRP